MIRPIRLACALAALLPLVLLDVAATPATVLAPCAAAANQPSGAMCGQVKVPEDRSLKGGREIALNVVVLPARTAAGRADPVFAIAGGPGIAATRLPATYPRLYDALQADHDIVLVDQRGTGGSHPLVCAQVDFTKTPERVFDEWPDGKALTACRDRLAKDTDLRHYGTAAAAAEDLEAVRQALGYTTAGVLATSYGTRVALEYLRRHGPRVRAIALSGIVPPSMKSGLTSAQDGDRALRKLFELCAADTSCNGAFPKLAADFDAVLAALDKGPASASVPLDNQPALKVTLSRPVFARELFQLLHSREDWLALPLAIHLAAAGNFMPFAGLTLQRELTRNPHADGMALSVLCAQDVASFPPAAMAATRGTFMRGDRLDFLKRACGVWPHAAVDAGAAAPVKSPVPALLISGALDPVTPPQNGVEVLKTLPNGVHAIVANAAHVPANPCVNGLIVSFLKAGSAKGLDTGCAGNLPPLKFVTSMPTNP